ncbi:class I SAM-dependent methyltransferase [Niallia oryzisoli]|uniref:Class I SAM-dependent methyltransferase n=1 Tax=Niallia oryzisoli TaxID=1737571 RepID=A0ABZ2C8M7_9BACI
MRNNSEELKSKVKQQFGTNAKKYVDSKSHAYGSDLPIIISWAEPKEYWVVLDIATGGGHVTKQLSPYVKQVFATDITIEMLNEAKKFLDQYVSNVSYIVADAERLPFLDETFDLITCRIAAHHFPNPQNFIGEVSRVLKPGGKFILVDNIVPEDERIDEFINTLELLRDHSHVRCYKEGEWKSWANNAGLGFIKSQIRKKTLDYKPWVQRTTTSVDQVLIVKEHIINADEHIQEYCGIKMNQGEIASFHLDEWMGLFEKNS